MKLFTTRSNKIVNHCIKMFNVHTTQYAITKRECKFLSNIMTMSLENALCEICR